MKQPFSVSARLFVTAHGVALEPNEEEIVTTTPLLLKTKITSVHGGFSSLKPSPNEFVLFEEVYLAIPLTPQLADPPSFAVEEIEPRSLSLLRVVLLPALVPGPDPAHAWGHPSIREDEEEEEYE